MEMKMKMISQLQSRQALFLLTSLMPTTMCRWFRIQCLLFSRQHASSTVKIANVWQLIVDMMKMMMKPLPTQTSLLKPSAISRKGCLWAMTAPLAPVVSSFRPKNTLDRRMTMMIMSTTLRKNILLEAWITQPSSEERRPSQSSKAKSGRHGSISTIQQAVTKYACKPETMSTKNGCSSVRTERKNEPKNWLKSTRPWPMPLSQTFSIECARTQTTPAAGRLPIWSEWLTPKGGMPTATTCNACC